MKYAFAVAAVAFGTALATVAGAQGRHDEKPHGSKKPAAASDRPASPGVTGRHDEKPHGPPKKKAAAKNKKDDDRKAEQK